MKAKLKATTKLPMGIYQGVWSGYEVTFKADGVEYCVASEKGLRGTFPCSVVLTEDKAYATTETLTPKEKVLSESPLLPKIKAVVQGYMMHLPTELGYRDDKAWTEEEGETLEKIAVYGDRLAERLMKLVESNK